MGDMESSTESLLIATSTLISLDIVFAIAGGFYVAKHLLPKATTRISEFIFPVDLCVKLAISFFLSLLYFSEWTFGEIRCDWCLKSDSPVRMLHRSRELVQCILWTGATCVLWIEFRRGCTPSHLVRLFWGCQWILSTYFFLFSDMSINDNGTTFLEIMLGIPVYVCTCVMAVSALLPSTPVSEEVLPSSRVPTSPTAYYAEKGRYPNWHYHSSNYGSFFEKYPVNSVSTISQPETEVDASHSDDRAIIHVSIPSASSAVWGKKVFRSYQVVIQAEEDQWDVRRQYQDFEALHTRLPSPVQKDCPLPCDEPPTTSSSKSQLERYLTNVLQHQEMAPETSTALCDFLDMTAVVRDDQSSTFSSRH